jgi:hypothetical protein
MLLATDGTEPEPIELYIRYLLTFLGGDYGGDFHLADGKTSYAFFPLVKARYIGLFAFSSTMMFYFSPSWKPIILHHCCDITRKQLLRVLYGIRRNPLVWRQRPALRQRPSVSE